MERREVILPFGDGGGWSLEVLRRPEARLGDAGEPGLYRCLLLGFDDDLENLDFVTSFFFLSLCCLA